MSLPRVILIVLTVFFVQTSFSQKNYLAGQIITLDGDTLNGQINYRNWIINPKKISFRSSTSSKKTVYVPMNIRGFVVSGKIYQSAIVKIEISPTQTSDLGFDPKLHFEIDTLFLQAIIAGTKSLYYYKNNNSNENFYIKQNGVFDLLIHKAYLEEGLRNYVKKENNKYLGQLALYLSDCASTQTLLKPTQYNLKSLRKLFQNYYKCTGSFVTYENIAHNVSLNIGALAGVSLTSLEFDGSASSIKYLVNTDFPNSFDFSLGLFLDIGAPKNLNRLSLYNELLYTSYSTSGTYEDFRNKDNYIIYDTKFAYSYLSINNMLRFKYPLKSSFVYFNAGISNNLPLVGKNSLQKKIKFHSSETTQGGEAIKNTKGIEHGLTMGLGISNKKIFLAIRYEKANGISEYIGLDSKTTRYFILLGYKLK